MELEGLDLTLLSPYQLRRRTDRVYSLSQWVKFAHAVPGDLVEMGVYQGASARIMLLAAPGRHYWGFDSFQGLSQPKLAIDGDYWSAGDLSADLAEVGRNLGPLGDRATLVPGWIPTTFATVNGPDLIAVAHIDVDLYSPTLESLRYCDQRTASGSILVCDDYGFDTCPGARLAIDEFVGECSHWNLVHLTTGQGLLIRQ